MLQGGDIRKIEIWLEREVSGQHHQARDDDRAEQPQSPGSKIVVNKEKLSEKGEKDRNMIPAQQPAVFGRRCAMHHQELEICRGSH